MPENRAAKKDRTYISGVVENYPARPSFEQFTVKAEAEGWRCYELPTGHDCDVEMAPEFTKILLGWRQGPLADP
jgi:hypothetical protein